MKRFNNRSSRFDRRCLMNWEATGVTPVFDVRNAKGDAPAEIMLYDEIGFWGVTAGDFVAALREAGPGPINVRINSPGGDVFDGMAILNALRAHDGVVSTFVDGLAASAASTIMLGGATVTAAETSMVMIHNAWSLAVGDKSDMLATAGVLAKIDLQIAGIYAAKADKPAAEFAAMMDAETWFTGQEAKDAGLVDVVSTSEGAAKNIVKSGIFHHTPVQAREERQSEDIQAGAARLRVLRMMELQKGT